MLYKNDLAGTTSPKIINNFEDNKKIISFVISVPMIITTLKKANNSNNVDT